MTTSTRSETLNIEYDPVGRLRKGPVWSHPSRPRLNVSLIETLRLRATPFVYIFCHRRQLQGLTPPQAKAETCEQSREGRFPSQSKVQVVCLSRAAEADESRRGLMFGRTPHRYIYPVMLLWKRTGEMFLEETDSSLQARSSFRYDLHFATIY